MPDLKAIYDSKEDIPTEPVTFADLFTEKGGKMELTGIVGAKTTADVERAQTATKHEKDNHKATKEKLEVWGDLKHDEVVAQLDKIPELEAAAKGTLDEAQVEEIVARRVEGTIKSQKAPLERQLLTITKERDELKGDNDKFIATDRTRKVHDQVRTAGGPEGAKVLPSAMEDALLLADRVFELTDEGKAVTKDGVGITPGMDPAGWFVEMQEKREHWWGQTKGGGARGGSGGGGFSGNNPWAPDTWNMTKQGEYLRQHGTEKATAMAKAAGTTLGGKRPEAKKTA